MRFAVFAGMHDPDDMGFWSGTPKHFIRGLRRHGHEVVTIGPLATADAAVGAAKTAFLSPYPEQPIPDEPGLRAAARTRAASERRVAATGNSRCRDCISHPRRCLSAMRCADRDRV